MTYTKSSDDVDYTSGMKSIGSKDMIRHIRDTSDIDEIEIEIDDKYDARVRAIKDEEQEKEDMRKMGDVVDEDILWS